MEYVETYGIWIKYTITKTYAYSSQHIYSRGHETDPNDHTTSQKDI